MSHNHVSHPVASFVIVTVILLLGGLEEQAYVAGFIAAVAVFAVSKGTALWRRKSAPME